MCAKLKQQEAQNPILIRCQRLIEAFAKSDDERDFFIDRIEGFIVYADLDKPIDEVAALEKELYLHADRYCLIPKLSFYETKKIMEGFINEKVYDIDTKEKLLEIIQSKEAKENFLEFIFDHHSEFEKWQQYYQERSRVRLIEWLRQNHFHFVFEEDIEIPRSTLEKLKENLFEPKVDKEISQARKLLVDKAKTYYSNEALNPRPKRGRPPKQIAKQETEQQTPVDIYLKVPSSVRPFLFTPDPTVNSSFSSKFETPESLVKAVDSHASIEQKLAALRTLSSRWTETEHETQAPLKKGVDAAAPAKKPAVAKAAASKTTASKSPLKSAPKKAVKSAKAKKAVATKQRNIIPAAKKGAESSNKKKRLKKIMPRKK